MTDKDQIIRTTAKEPSPQSIGDQRREQLEAFCRFKRAIDRAAAHARKRRGVEMKDFAHAKGY